MTYRFRRAVAEDTALLVHWLQADHLQEWFGDWLPELDRDDVRSWIVLFDDAPLGYIQDYRVGDFADHPLDALPPDASGIDQFIGPTAMLGLGHGPAFITQHVAHLIGDGAPAVGTDPDPRNSRAIRAYEKAGFRPLGPPRDSEHGRVLPMALWATAQ